MMRQQSLLRANMFGSCRRMRRILQTASMWPSAAQQN
jgi:hypothetical protein